MDVSVVNIDSLKEKALNLALNKVSGRWDEVKLHNPIIDLEKEGVNLDLTGFNALGAR